MQLLSRVKLREIQWAPLVAALILTGFGVAFVISACYDPGQSYGLGHEAKAQLVWWLIGLAACLTAMHVPLATWRRLAIPLYASSIFLQFFMIAAAGSALVPRVKGQCNWIVIGSQRLQPSEFIKLAALVCCARVISAGGFEAERFLHICGALAVGAFPALLIAGTQDLGSALTFPPMVLGMLFLAGMRFRHLALILLTMAATMAVGVANLPKTGPKAYMYQRIQAWMDPDAYALAEGYQTMRSIRSIGSGQWLGKGYATGDQNRLGWLPEKHTDLIFAVVGEEVGFVGSVSALLLFLVFAWSCIYLAMRCRDPFGRILAAGYVCLVLGEASINLAVALGLMPVTGITLPFFSYGGSSLLACYLGLGMILSASAAPRRELSRPQWS